MSGINQLIDYILLAIFLFILLYIMTESRLSKRATAVVLAVVNAIVLIVTAMIMNISSPGLAMPYAIVIVIGSNIVVSFFLSRKRDFTSFFSVLLVASFALALRSIEGVIYYLLHDYKITIIFIIICYGIIAYFTITWIRPAFIRLSENMREIWQPLSLLPLAFIVLFFLMTVYPAQIGSDPDTIPALLVLFPVQIFLYYFILKSYLRLEEETKKRQDMHALNNQISLVKNQENLVMAAEDRVRIYRHDLRHYMQLVTACLDEGNIEKARGILSELTDQVEASTKIETFCSNLTLNAVISHYMQRCGSHGIEMHTDIKLPDKLPVDDMSFAVVLSNALENAFNACTRVEGTVQPVIDLTCAQTKTQLFLEVRNTFDGTVYFDKNGKLPISMDEEHGIGTRSISQFAEKNGAILDYSTEGGIFTMHMLLYIK